MNEERILALADLIEPLPLQPEQYEGDPEKAQFGMAQWWYSCGTPSCVAGWAAHMAASERVTFPPDVVTIQERGAYYLGISEETSEHLFMADRTRYPIHQLTARAAAWCLRNLVKTRRVAWTKAMKETADV